jgi:hypothetical protein
MDTLVTGENAGYQMPSTLDRHYVDRSSSGMMADSIRHATSCHFQVFYWPYDRQPFGTARSPFSPYLHDIAEARR